MTTAADVVVGLVLLVLLVKAFLAVFVWVVDATGYRGKPGKNAGRAVARKVEVRLRTRTRAPGKLLATRGTVRGEVEWDR